ADRFTETDPQNGFHATDRMPAIMPPREGHRDNHVPLEKIRPRFRSNAVRDYRFLVSYRERQILLNHSAIAAARALKIARVSVAGVLMLLTGCGRPTDAGAQLAGRSAKQTGLLRRPLRLADQRVDDLLRRAGDDPPERDFTGRPEH